MSNFVNSFETCKKYRDGLPLDKKCKNRNPPKAPYLPTPVPTEREPSQTISLDLL